VTVAAIVSVAGVEEAADAGGATGLVGIPDAVFSSGASGIGKVAHPVTRSSIATAAAAAIGGRPFDIEFGSSMGLYGSGVELVLVVVPRCRAVDSASGSVRPRKCIERGASPDFGRWQAIAILEARRAA
jgi:hypothetical protein